MGGHGSTRWGVHSKKICVESCLYLCAAELKHEGIINTTGEEKALVWREYGRDEIIASVRCLCQQAGSDYELALSYRTREEQDISYCIEIIQETRFVGKKAPVFHCPLCGRRARKLYLPCGALHFGCRACYDLTYKSCQTAHRYDRGNARRYGMHKKIFPQVRTYYRLSSEPIYKIA
jgi:hypothetical protein